MGSAEFEFGSLPKSLRRLRDGTVHTGIIKEITLWESPLRFLTVLCPEDMEKYKKFLVQMWEDRGIHLKERSEFRKKDRLDKEESKFLTTNFWWDIENDVIWSFDKNYMNRLPDYLRNSFSKMA